MKSTKCHQPFVFGPSRRYISQILVKLPVLVTRLDGSEDVLVIQTYLVDAEVPFLCGKQTLENWNFKIDSSGANYTIILETRKKPDSSLLLLDDVSEGVLVLFLEDAEGDL